jgi:hypothetical protein
MAEARALLKVRQRQTSLAATELQRAEGECRRIEARLTAAIADLESRDASIDRERRARIAALVGQKSGSIAVARLCVAHEADDEELAALAKGILAIEAELNAARARREEASRLYHDRLKAEKKIENLAGRLEAEQRHRADSLAEEEP